MSGKLRVERNCMASTSSDGSCSHQRLLIALLKLITSQPLLLIRQRGKEDEGCIDSVVSALVLLIDHPQLHSGAMQALLALHSVISHWNYQSPRHAMQSFFTVGSHMLFSVCQKLIHFQIPNAEHVITWIKAIMQYR
uniref:Neurofibromin n=2 Tax=Panagrolaimus sp. PS1159 TaxID=55785 RepID=A0AC35GDQ1_9BILA